MNKPIPFKVLIPTKRKVVEKLMNGNANLITWYFQAIDAMLCNVKVWEEEMHNHKQDYRSKIWQMDFVLYKIGSLMNSVYQLDKTDLEDASKRIQEKYTKAYLNRKVLRLEMRHKKIVERAEDAIEKRKQKQHVLYSGQLWDMPGRMETWKEYVSYSGENKWVLSIEGTDFSGLNPGGRSEEIKNTDQLISWVLERDDENRNEESDDEESSVDRLSMSEDSGSEKRSLGQRGSRLREIALKVGARDCVKSLDDWARG